MQTYRPEQIRNVALMGHSKSGKTSLCEAMVFASGATSRVGRVEDGNTVSDYDEQEHLHGYSIGTALVAIEWNGHRINLLDTPGYADFEGEVVSAAAAADAVVITVDAVSGIEGGTDAAWEQAEHAGVPARFFAIARIDRENADFHRVLGALRERFGSRVVPLALPGGEGVTQVLSGDGSGLSGPLAEAREMLTEAVAETDDELLEAYLDGQSIEAERLRVALCRAVHVGAVVPVLPVCATGGIGVKELMDSLVEFAPNPLGRAYPTEDGESLQVTSDGPLVARVFKTTVDPFIGHLSFVKVLSGRLTQGGHALNARGHADERTAHLYLMRGKEQIEVSELAAGDIGAIPKLMQTHTGDVLVGPGETARMLPPLPFPEPTYRSAIHPRSRDDVDKVSQALARIQEQDPTVRIERGEDSGEVILLTLGEVHAGIAAARLQRENGVTVDVTEPRVPYVETIRSQVQAEYRHKKQSGGRGQFGHVVIKVEPLARGAGFEFAEQVVGGNVPRQFIPAVEHGIVEALPTGPLAKSRLVDLKVTLLDGSSHSVDSSEIAFKIAAAQALHQAVLEAQPVLLEPVMRLRVVVPSDVMGAINGEITSRRGSVIGFEQDGEATTVEALAPLAEVQRFGPQLRSLTHGRGRFTLTFDHYAEVPPHVQERVLAEREAHEANALRS